MRRFASVAVLLFFSVPFGASLAGCHKSTPPTYCNISVGGPIVGQLTTLDLEPRLTGISLNQGQIGSTQQPTGTDCKGSTVGVSGVTYSLNPQTPLIGIPLLDINPANGSLCAGSWNRNTGGGIADFTVCTPTTLAGTVYLTASSGGVTSNAIPVFVHPIVTSIVLGQASTCATVNGVTSDPASNCSLTPVTAANPTGCGPAQTTVTTTGAVAVPPYTGLSCISQGSAVQLVARAFAGPATAPVNVTCQVGPLTFTAQNAGVGTIQSNGVITAAAPGSSIVNASAGGSLASSSAGFFSTCPPASIVLTTQGSAGVPTGSVQINQNITQNLVATVTDTNGAPITNLSLTYESTSPNQIPTSTSPAITPAYPGASTITATCQPPACNTSSFSQIGLFGNGTPIFSNPLQITSQGTNSSTVLYIGSTQSQFILPIDFTQPSQSALIRLKYVPNSMVISQDQSTIYLGTSYELIAVNTANNTVTREDSNVRGSVLSVSPDSSRVVITDPIDNLVYLYNSSGSIATEYGGTGISAQWSPDSSTVFITTTDGRMLVYSTFTGWTSVPLSSTSIPATSLAVTVPNAGVYLGSYLNPTTGVAQATVTGRTVCPQTTQSAAFPNPQATNVFYPLVDQPAVNATALAASNDGLHLFGATPTLGATVGSFIDVATNKKSGACGQPTLAFTSKPGAPIPFSGGVVPQALPLTIPMSPSILTTTDSAYAFVTYTGTGGALPVYNPATATLTNVPLSTKAGTPLAPVNAAVSTDNQTVYAGTSGDNQVHVLIRSAAGFADNAAALINPQLPNFNGGSTSVPNLIVLRPRKSTN